ncbi:ADP-ribosylglycohydrolase family protein [Aureliella helgolandensis]|uniref:ADP-ribosylglycohydrolase n=1 Tax=Aureliella helgolandensis TaxID=2527968 RepID=A0A518GGJ7_9BACT|nr:ADP-ribosylglycohydrolase family protein [Aureliella helgolandensis]QDV27697.1 ADP-ribosylglycohydrolase [Aureliella helgolandensis]
MHSTHLRKIHIHGALLGAALGDALGRSRTNLSRRDALRKYGPLSEGSTGRRMYSGDTQLMLLTAQALLKSRSDLRSFRKTFHARLAWYGLSFPVDPSASTMLAAWKSWLARVGLRPGVDSLDNGAGAQAVFSALAIDGTGHNIGRWVDETVHLTRTNSQTRNACVVLGELADLSANTKRDNFEPSEVLAKAIQISSHKELTRQLKALTPFLQGGKSPAAVARHFGWQDGVSHSMVDTTVMAIYCWLRYPDDFKRATTAAIHLGGDSKSLGAIVGGLSGAHLGVAGIPSELPAMLGGSPHGPTWIASLAERFSHWPHGVDDLHRAPPQKTRPLLQLLRNGWERLRFR